MPATERLGELLEEFLQRLHNLTHQDDFVQTERMLELIMAKIDDFEAAFASLDSAVRTMLDQGNVAIEALQTEIATLQADDDVENSKLDGLVAAADELRTAVVSFGQETPQDPPPEPPAEPPAEGEPAGEPPPV